MRISDGSSDVCSSDLAAGIPAVLGFSDVRNHLNSAALLELMGTDLFVFHGWSAVYVDGKWRKGSPAFNSELCRRFGVPPLEFDGSRDALLHAAAGAGRRHMEYVRGRGRFRSEGRRVGKESG